MPYWYDVRTGIRVVPSDVEGYSESLRQDGYAESEIAQYVARYYTQDRQAIRRAMCHCGCGLRVLTHGARFRQGHHWALRRRLIHEQDWQTMEDYGWSRPRARRIALNAFGVEAEFFGIDLSAAVYALRNAGLEAQDDGYHHNQRPYWRITTDSSVHFEGLECVSPVLRNTPHGKSTVSRAVGSLRSRGATIDVSCGLHVHHNALDMDAFQIESVVGHYELFRPVLDSLVSPSRRGNSEWAGITPMEILARGKQEARGESRYFARFVAGREGRYRAVNVESFLTHGSLEFRQHQGTLNPQKINNWVSLTGLFMQAGREGRDYLEPIQEHGNLFAFQRENGLSEMMAYLKAPAELSDYYVRRQLQLSGVSQDAEDADAETNKLYDNHEVDEEYCPDSDGSHCFHPSEEAEDLEECCGCHFERTIY